MASDPESVWPLELDLPAVSALVAPGPLADDFQYAGGEGRYRMADAGFHDCSRPSACRWRQRGTAKLGVRPIAGRVLYQTTGRMRRAGPCAALDPDGGTGC